MSREIKFRVWSESDKEYRADLLPELTPPFITADYNDEGDRFIIEQYTGLTDKNGKEIYEGDVVRARWYRAKNARFNTEGKVEYNDGWFHIQDDPDCHDRLGVPIHDCYDLEVIGNVHEKLLGGEE